jgi:tetratricopeptide (TPR) repeat protein
VSTLLRWFSPAYRYALQAEAEGRYIDAARAFALCGQRLKVAEMHLLEAERRGTPPSALRELHIATHFADDHSDFSRELRKRLGQLYLRVLKECVLGPAERELCAEAATLLLQAGEPASAAAAYELGGDLERAASAYEQAGDIDKVEALHATIAEQRLSSERERQAIATYRAQLELGQRREALATLQHHSRLATDPSATQQLLGELGQRLLPAGQVRLRQRRRGTDPQAAGAAPSRETVYLGRFPIALGRSGAGGEALPPWADAGLSRDHAQIEVGSDADGAPFLLRDLGSKNGTTLDGLPIAGPLPLRGDGEIGLGKHICLHFVVVGRTLELAILRGRGQGLRLVGSPQPIALTDGLELHFSADDGQPLLVQTDPSFGELLLNGKRAPRRLQLLRDDIVELGELRLEVG